MPIHRLPFWLGPINQWYLVYISQLLIRWCVCGQHTQKKHHNTSKMPHKMMLGTSHQHLVSSGLHLLVSFYHHTAYIIKKDWTS